MARSSAKKRRRALQKPTPLDSLHESRAAKRGKGARPQKHVPVDAAFTAVAAPLAWVLQDDGDIFDAQLHRVDLEAGRHETLVLQVIATDGGCYVWEHVALRHAACLSSEEGAVPVEGTSMCSGLLTQSKATAQFGARFAEKTSVLWSERLSSTAADGEFSFVALEYPSMTSSLAALDRETLDDEVRLLMSVVFDDAMAPLDESESDDSTEDAMEPAMPLQLPYAAIVFDKANAILAQIDDVLAKKDSKARRAEKVMALSNRYFAALPHDFTHVHGGNLTTYAIDSVDKVENCKETIKELQMNGISGGHHVDWTPMDALEQKYATLGCDLAVVANESAEFGLVQRYLENSKAHVQHALRIRHVFRVTKHGEDDTFKPFAGFANRKLLWHGSTLANWSGILKEGLQIAPPNVATNGHSFGKGIYFSDSVSRSAPYCRATSEKKLGILLLSEVALGQPNECFSTNSKAQTTVNFTEYHSVVGLGSYTPAPNEEHVLPDGATIPIGKLTRQVRDSKRAAAAHLNMGSGLEYNEYVIYNPAQTRMRFLVLADFFFD
ncbi:Aste57867_8769 [Aphanomyces stellatus]|uniref:Poly [ADP-ribose] polymerase n=1 Tax=Aphanomyces stellatus TaxID=120398 RepID=A0A485KLA5_9STRA|nr:hypothetical protein As57867_008735 [Aphanomyces stellatus]VFT85655.1 Aste57867_8769 [Aphanomyces stellatus]